MPGIEWVTPDGQPVAAGADSLEERQLSASRRRWLVLLTVLAVVLAAGGGVALATHNPSPKALTVTLRGARVDDAKVTIASADKEFRAYVRTNGGTLTKQSRCYFGRIAAQSTDVATTVFCAPALFADGALPADFLSYDLAVTHLANGHVTLTPNAQPTSPVPGLPPLPQLERPDHKQFTVPSDLAVPAALTTPPNSLMTVNPDQLSADFDVSASGQMGSPKLLVALQGATFIGQIGAGAQIRRPPVGSRLLAFGVAVISDKYDSLAGVRYTLGLQVDGGTVRELRPMIPQDSYSTSVDFVATVPAQAQSIQLVFDGAGFLQTLSLPYGKPGANNLGVYEQPVRDSDNTFQTGIPATVDDHGTITAGSVDLTVSGEHLEYYTDYGVTPSAHDHAFLHVDICYSVVFAVNASCVPFPASMLTLTASGHDYRAVDIAPGTDEYPVFEVPAYFGPATLIVSGTGSSGGVTVTLPDAFDYQLTLNAN